ncbi:hypothetical protein PLCT2_02994 [Planctomycetaceae bacterium]|nr:hypothetical protein PLCT2_02994 [Planctomycetaceae bacterium]
MRRTSFLLCLPIFGCSLLFFVPQGAQVSADDKKPSTKEAPKASTVDAADLAEANKALSALSDAEYASLCATHYLMRPSIEGKLFEGKARNLCPLEPLEKQGSGDLSTSETLRLWALLDAGVPDSEPLQRAITRLLRTSPRSRDTNLARQGVHILALCAVLKRMPANKSDNHLGAARTIVASAERHEICSDDSATFTVQGIGMEWFANQFWRGLINRCALDLGLRVNAKRWGNDLALLEKVYLKGIGWTTRQNGTASAYETERQDQDLHANLLAMAALSLASGATDAEFSKESATSIAASAARAPELLSSLITEFEGLPLNGARLLLLLASKFAPKGRDPILWREAIISAHAGEYRATGRLSSYSSMPRCLGFEATPEDNAVEDIAEVCLGAVGISGGILRPLAGPFASRSHAEVARLLWARTIKEAAEAPELSAIVGHALPEAQPITPFMENGLSYLVKMQDKSGGWGGPTFGGKQVEPTTDPATTAFCALALMRMGNTPLSGPQKDALKRALDYMIETVEKAPEEGPSVTSATSTQPQRKLGPLIDTAMATQFLARVLSQLGAQPALQSRAERALDKCIRKIEQSQDEDGTWNKNGGWAPVLQSAMMNQALELSDLSGRKVSKTVLEKSRGHYAEDPSATVVGGKGRGRDAGVGLYSGATAQRVTAKDVREARDGIMVAVQMGKLNKGAAVSESNLLKAGFTKQQARVKASAYARFEAENKKLDDPNYLKGFGNNGGEEFISFMLCSESLVISGGDNWKKWTQQMHETYKGIQNGDGSWSGHHCISNPVVCTAAALLCMTADREVHVKIEPAPLLRKSIETETAPPEKGSKKEGPITGN